MFEWKIEDMALMNERCNTYIGIEKIYNCETKLSREEKIAFVDSMQDGNLSYILNLVEKFEKEKENLTKDQYGCIKTVSLKAWIIKNDSRKLIDNHYSYGRINFTGERNIQNIKKEM